MSSLEIGERSFCDHLLANVVILRAVFATDFSETNWSARPRVLMKRKNGSEEAPQGGSLIESLHGQEADRQRKRQLGTQEFQQAYTSARRQAFYTTTLSTIAV